MLLLFSCQNESITEENTDIIEPISKFEEAKVIIGSMGFDTSFLFCTNSLCGA
jgi:hypothetical protein